MDVSYTGSMSERETWIVAVSGGIDSAVLLDMLVESQAADLVVAHVDHGIRKDSAEDAELVQRMAEKYELPYEVTQLHLGASASEQLARDERYAWLDSLRQKYHATAVATAHHQDDLIETMILNMQRGTGWRGLCSLRETATRKRPMLILSKASIASYAIERGLEWREDSTNDDLRYRRNYIRHGIMPRLDTYTRREFIKLYNAQLALRTDIENEITELRATVKESDGLSRYWLIMLPESVAVEILRTTCEGVLVDQQLRRLLLFAKTARVNAIHEPGGGITARVTLTRLIVSRASDLVS